MAGWLRHAYPEARLIGTFHDVQSQQYSREAAEAHGSARRLLLRFNAALARRFEARAMQVLDRAIVFSDKDAALLPRGKADLVVIHPPLAGDFDPRRPSSEPTVLMVGYFARTENIEALRFLLEEIWPHVLVNVSDARLRLVGGGMPSNVAEYARGFDNVDVVGFIDRLAPEYAAAWVAVVPLKRGAGVKFKTLEALLAGTTTVTTPIGAEGIGGEDLFATLSDDPTAIASGLVEVLGDPARANAAAQRTRELLAETYGWEAFQGNARSAYLGNSRYADQARPLDSME